MRIYDEENIDFEDEENDMAGYRLIEEHSIYKKLMPQKEEETVATPIPQNEQTVLLCEPNVSKLKDGALLTLEFTQNDGCTVKAGGKTVGSLKPAYVKKLKTERGGQNACAYFKQSTPPMVRIVFGEGSAVPLPDNE